MTRHSRPLLGLGYLVTVSLLVALSIGIYNKALPWQRSATVDFETTQVGLGLRAHADVKYQGVLVGEVRDVRTNGTRATVTLALDHDRIGLIPADIDAMVVPKTLFGDKFVDLRQPAKARGAASARLADGDRIAQSSTAVELGEIFDRLVPVLQTLQPERLSAVLSSLAQAVDGRGTSIAAGLRSTQTLLGRLAPSYDDLVADVNLLATTANAYADSAPDLLSALGDSAAISRQNLTPHEADFGKLLDSVTGTATTTRQVLETNRNALVQLSGRSRPVLQVLANYSSEVPCVLRALDYGNRLANLASGVRGPYIALSIDMFVDRPAYEYPKDLPSNPRSDANVKNLPAVVPGWGPHCPVLPTRVTDLPTSPPPYSQQPYSQTFDLGAGKRSGSTGTPRDEVLARAVAAQKLGVGMDKVPGYAELLLLPLLADGKVAVR